MASEKNEGTKTRETNFSRQYKPGDNGIISEISHEDAVIGTLDLSRVPQEVKDKAAIRYLTDGVVNAGNAAMKADGGTAEKAAEKMEAAINSAYDGSWTFRAASGESGLSTEEEHGVIAATLVELGKFPDADKALAWVKGVYGEVVPQTRKSTKDGVTSEKTVETRPKYNKLKRHDKIRSALAAAQPATGNDELDAMLAG